MSRISGNIIRVTGAGGKAVSLPFGSNDRVDANTIETTHIGVEVRDPPLFKGTAEELLPIFRRFIEEKPTNEADAVSVLRSEKAERTLSPGRTIGQMATRMLANTPKVLESIKLFEDLLK